MPENEFLLGLTRDQVAAVGLNIVHENDRARITSTGGDLFEIQNEIGSDQQREIGKYLVRHCYTGFSAQSQITRLRLRDSDRTIGYVFPVTAFRGGEALEGIWPKRYADVAFRVATKLESLSTFAVGASLDGCRGRSLFLDELIPDEVSILAIGREALETADIGWAVLELMLLKERIAILPDPLDVPRSIKADAWRDSITVKKPAYPAEGEAAIFTALIRSADRDAFGVAAFMHLYQALEFCIDHIFNWEIGDLVQAKLDTWKMKDRLAEITGERRRLAILDARCLARLQDRASLNELRNCCLAFLQSVNVDHDADGSWFSLLYQARNIIVHNQIQMLKRAGVPLREMNKLLRAASLDILFAFENPALQARAKFEEEAWRQTSWH